MVLKELTNLERYKDFTILDKPIPFETLFANQNIACVQLHSIEPCGDDIVGFCGVCSWKDNEIHPEDGDTYSAKMPVYGYSWFTVNGEKVLDILVDEW